MSKRIVNKTIIVNYGDEKKGKSTSIRGVYHELQKKHELKELREVIRGKQPDSDISALFEINGVRFGLESQGEPDSRIFDSLDEFIKNECDIIIVSCRTEGEVIKKIESLGDQGYRIIWTQNYLCDDCGKALNLLNTLYILNIIVMIHYILNGDL